MVANEYEKQTQENLPQNSTRKSFKQLGIHKKHLSKDTSIKNIWKLTLKERLILELIMLAPVFIVLAVLYTTSNFLLTLFIFHICLITLPLLFLRSKNLFVEFKYILFQEIVKKAERIKHMLKLVGFPVLLCLTNYIIFRNIHKDFAVESLRTPDMAQSIGIFLLSFEFVILNPIIEEIFWRVFCDSFTGQGKTFLQKLDLSFHYAIFHWFVLYFMCQDVIISSLGFLFIWFLGFVLTITKQKAGLITAMLVHLGVDLAAGLAVWDMKAKLFPLY